jgi:hypothetical protein
MGPSITSKRGGSRFTKKSAVSSTGSGGRSRSFLEAGWIIRMNWSPLLTPTVGIRVSRRLRMRTRLTSMGTAGMKAPLGGTSLTEHLILTLHSGKVLPKTNAAGWRRKKRITREEERRIRV